VIVNHKLEVSVDGSVNQANAVSLSGSEGRVVARSTVFESICAVDETIVKNWWADLLSLEVELINRLFHVSFW